MQNIDPVRSREHILLSNIFENAWSQGKDLDLGELILQTQSPPFPKLGVFDVNTFFPEKDRFELAMLLNNILAAPAFQVWIEGQPLDIPSSVIYPRGQTPPQCVLHRPPERFGAHVLHHPALLGGGNLDALTDRHHQLARPGLF